MLDRLSRLDTCTISDGLDTLGLAGATIGVRPLWKCPKVVGRAMTIRAGPKTNAAPTDHLNTPAIYAFPSCEELIGKTTAADRRLTSDEAVVNALLDEAGVATVHGSAFGLSGYFRIAYALDDRALAQACNAIIDFCRSLRL